MKHKVTWGLLAVFGIAAIISICAGAEVPEKDRIQIITKLTGMLISKQHYSQQPLDVRKSRMLFDEYFRHLDPDKMYFTETDVARYFPKRDTLGRAVLAGDASFAFEVFEKFRLRFDEYCAFAEKELAQKNDFTADETFVPDRRKLPRAKNDAELHKLWRAKLKNNLLYFRLVKRAMDLDAKNLKKNDDPQAEKAAVRALWEKRSPEEKILRRLKDLQNFYHQREKVDILGGFLSALAAAYGPHTGYQAPKQDEDFNIDMSLSLIGIGVTLTSDDGYIRVVNIVPGGPVDRDGRIHEEDRIIAVAEEGGEPVDVIDMAVDNAVKLIRGGAAGTKVILTVLPGKKGRNAVPENIAITREKVVLKDSEAQGKVSEVHLANRVVKVGVIELSSFYMDFEAMFRGDADYKSCTRDVKRILEDFKKQDVQAVVMDLRGNTGGSLAEAVSLTGLFIPTGPVVQVRQKNGKPEVESDENASVVWDGPLVILTNKMSASAAEIFAAAIKDYRRGILAGDSRTYGKGTVLSVVPLEKMLGLIDRHFPAGSVRLETAMFFRINGDSVQQLGVRPDVVLPSLTEPLEIGEMFSSNHLPWDSIAPLSYRLSDPEMNRLLPRIREASRRRILADKEYQVLQKRCARLKEHLAAKSVSLNEEKRWKEYLRDREFSQEDDIAEAEETLNSRKRKSVDPVLNEAKMISADYYCLKKRLVK